MRRASAYASSTDSPPESAVTVDEPPARSVDVAFDFQLVAEVPETPGDVTVSLIVTDGQILEPAR